MPGTQRANVCGPGGGVQAVVEQLQRDFRGSNRPDFELAASRHISNIRHLWVLAFVNGTRCNDDTARSARADAELAVTNLERVMAERDMSAVDVDGVCRHLKANPGVVREHGVMYVCHMLWTAIFWRDRPVSVREVPRDLKILDLFHLDSLRRAAQVPELRAAALSIFAHRFDLRPGERVLAQYQVPSSSAKLSLLQVLEFVRPAPYVVGLANTITFADMSVILRDSRALETLVFAMLRARAMSLVQGFDFVHCVWSAPEMECNAGLQSVVRAARIKPIIVRYDVNRYLVCDNRGDFFKCSQPQQVISMWRYLLKVRYADTLDNRLSFAGLLE